MLVEFSAQADLVGLEKLNKNFCLMKIKNNKDLPENLLMSRETYEKNKNLLVNCLKDKNLSLSINGFIKKKDNQFIFYVYGVFEAIVRDIPEEIELLAKQRLEAKQNKDYKKADELRIEIINKGYNIKDLPENKYEITRI